MQEKLFLILKDNFPDLVDTDGSAFIYPKHIPGNKLPHNAIVYNVVIQTIQYTQLSSTVQISVFSKTYADGQDIANRIAQVFNEQRYEQTDDFISSQVQSITDLGFDPDGEYHQTAVSLFIKSKFTN